MREKGDRFHGGEGASKEKLSRKIRKKHEWVSGCRSSPGGSRVSWFHSKCDQTWNGKIGWKTKGLLIR